MSMQRIANYGSFLQAYGLKKTLENFGHEVVFIDYKIEPCKVQVIKEDKTFIVLKNRILQKIFRIKNQVKRYQLGIKYDSFKEFQNRYNTEYIKLLDLKEKHIERIPVDTLIIGSDEVFNCLQTNPKVGYSKELFGYNANTNNLISYAASFGNTTYEGLCKYKIQNEIGDMLKKFSSISVRDYNSEIIIKKLIGVIPEKHIDPVFLYDYKKEMLNNPSRLGEREYIVVYAYDRRMSKEEGKIIKEYAKNKGKLLLGIGGDQSFCDASIYPNPFELLNIINNATCVFTDTFHGCVFSIKLNKQFVVFVRDGAEQKYGNRQKIIDLLQRFNLEERCVNLRNDIISILEKKINYDKINKIVEYEKERSINYLTKNI